MMKIVVKKGEVSVFYTFKKMRLFEQAFYGFLSLKREKVETENANILSDFYRKKQKRLSISQLY